jgi:hypothetical protein
MRAKALYRPRMPARVQFNRHDPLESIQHGVDHAAGEGARLDEHTQSEPALIVLDDRMFNGRRGRDRTTGKPPLEPDATLGQRTYRWVHREPAPRLD